MSNINDKATVELFVNGKQAADTMADLSARADELRKNLDAAKAAGNTGKGYKQLERELKQVEKQMARVESASKGTGVVLNDLTKSSIHGLRNALKHLQKELSYTRPGSEQWRDYAEKIETVKARLAELNEELGESKSAWQRFKEWSFNTLPALVLIKEGFDSAVQGLRKYVDVFADMDQEMANVRKYTGMTEGQVADLNEEFKKMDTRSSREDLNKLAQEAGRLGKTSKEDVMGFVNAADKINVALDDLGDGATLTLSKLTGIYGEEKRYGTEQSLLKVGSVINDLSQNCSASAPYIAEFASRIGGVGAQAGMTVQQIMGLAAVLDSNNQKVEASATAVSQVLVRLYQDPAKYAKVAGMDVDAFTKKLRTDANGALIEFLETLQKAGGMDVLSPMFADMGETGSRAISALATLAQNIDQVKAQQAAANKAFEEGTSITTEFAVQNGTWKASLEKCMKTAQEMRVELGEQLAPLMKHLMTSGAATMRIMLVTVKYIMSHKAAIISLTAAIAAYTIAVNLAQIKQAAFFAILKAEAIWYHTFRTATFLLSSAMALLSGNVKKATVEFKLFSLAIKANPIGLIVSVITGAIAALSAFLAKEKEVAEEEKRLAKERKAQAEEFNKQISSISAKAAEYADQELKQLRELYSAATDESLAKQKRIEAAKRLQSLFPSYFSQMSTEQIMLGKGITQYEALSKSIIKAARARAAYEKIKENESLIIELEMQNSEMELTNIGLTPAIQANKKALDVARNNLERGVNGAEVGVRKFRDLVTSDVSVYNQNRYQQKANKQKIEQIRKKNETLEKIAVDYEPQEVDSALTTPATTGYVSQKKLDKEAKAAAKENRAATAAAKREQAKQKKEFKEGLNAIKAELASANAETLTLYSQGSISYLEMLDRNHEAQQTYFADSIKFYEDYFSKIKDAAIESDKDYQELKSKQAEEGSNFRSKLTPLGVAEVKRRAAEDEKYARQRYELSKKTDIDEIALQEEILKIQVESIEKQMSLYNAGSEEYEKLRQQLDDTIRDATLNRQLRFAQEVEKLRAEYRKKSAVEQYKEEMAALEALLNAKKISERDYLEYSAALRNKYRGENGQDGQSLPGATPSASGNAKAAEMKHDKELKELKEALDAGLITQKEFEERSRNIGHDMRDALIAPIASIGNEWLNMFSNLYSAWDDFGDSLKGSTEQKLKAISAAVGATTAVVTAGMSIASDYAKAQAQIELAAIEKRYSREKELAQGNSYLLNKLEKEKQEEQAKIKNEASRKEFQMKVVQSVAQTIQAALNAYASTAAIPVIGPALAPAAAAVATAFGMAQVAMIQKQQKASEAQGYADGGFTPAGRRDKAVGVVHAGEWVASQKLVNNPRVRPLLEALDAAQRNNTVGMLRAEDVSRSLTAGDSLARFSENTQGMALMAAAAARLAEASDKLKERLDDPLVAVASVAGPMGVNKAQSDYNKLLRNKSPKTLTK